MALKGSLFWEVFHISLESILAHKLRTFLTLLGIIIGVASVVVVGSGIEGTEAYVVNSVSKALGSNSFVVSRFPRFGHISREEFEKLARRNPYLHLEDIAFLRERCPDCAVVAGEVTSLRTTYIGNEEINNTRIRGVTANMIFLGSLELAEGRFLTDQDVNASRFVCVIGWDLREKLFKHRDPLGHTLKVRNQPMTVIGVLEKQGSAFGQSLDNILYLPITAYRKMFGTWQSVTIRGRTNSAENFDDAVNQARVAMRIRHKLKPNQDDDFGLVSTDEINQSVGQFSGTVAMVITPITLISLLVGGIVVMNIMLVSVTERTFEIGLRKAMGARRRDILIQFLIESLILAILGGIFGLSLAWIISRIVESTTSLPMKLTLGYISLALGVSGGVGILFGIYPAFKASKLNPIEAISAER